MPLVRIDLIKGKSADYKGTLSQTIHRAMCETLNVPKDDRFQVVTEHPEEHFIFDPAYLGIQRSSDCIFIQITLNTGRSVEQKRLFYQAVAEGVQQGLKVRPEDILISLVEVGKENWSFGNGEAQYAPV